MSDVQVGGVTDLRPTEEAQHNVFTTSGVRAQRNRYMQSCWKLGGKGFLKCSDIVRGTWQGGKNNFQRNLLHNNLLHICT